MSDIKLALSTSNLKFHKKEICYLICKLNHCRKKNRPTNNDNITHYDDRLAACIHKLNHLIIDTLSTFDLFNIHSEQQMYPIFTK